MSPKRSASTSPEPSTSSSAASSDSSSDGDGDGDGAAAGSGGRDYSPYSHGRHDADKGQLGASIQFDLVPKAHGKASVPGRGQLQIQPVTHY